MKIGDKRKNREKKQTVTARKENVISTRTTKRDRRHGQRIRETQGTP